MSDNQDIPNWIANIEKIEPFDDSIKLLCRGKDDNKRHDITLPINDLVAALHAAQLRAGKWCELASITIHGDERRHGVPLLMKFADGKTEHGIFVKPELATEFAKVFFTIANSGNTSKH